MRTILYIVICLLFSSCFLLMPGNLTDNAFYNIDDASIRLIVKHNSDTLYKTSYEENYKLPGKYYKLLSTTNSVDTSKKLGIQIKLWAKIVMNENGTYYGYCPKNGLLEKIDKIAISLRDAHSVLDLSPYLKGDSTIKEVKWRKCDYKKLPYSWGTIPYFKDPQEMLKSINNGSELKQIPDHDYILWLDKEAFNKLSFKPAYLHLKIVLVDSTGTKYRQLTDSVIIK